MMSKKKIGLRFGYADLFLSRFVKKHGIYDKKNDDKAEIRSIKGERYKCDIGGS